MLVFYSPHAYRCYFDCLGVISLLQLPALNDAVKLIHFAKANPRIDIETMSDIASRLITVAVHAEATEVLDYFTNSLDLSLEGNGADRSPLMIAVQFGYDQKLRTRIPSASSFPACPQKGEGRSVPSAEWD